MNPHPLPDGAVPKFWQWCEATGFLRQSLWAAIMPHMPGLAYAHRSTVASSLREHELCALLQSPQGLAFLQELDGTVLTWMLIAKTQGPGVARSLALHAPWPKRAKKTGRKGWVGRMSDAQHVLTRLLKDGDDATGMAFIHRLSAGGPMPQQKLRITPEDFLSGHTPACAQWALGDPTTGEGAMHTTPDAFAACVAKTTHWNNHSTTMLALAWMRGLTPTGWICLSVPSRNTKGASYTTSCALAEIGAHKRLRFLATIGNPYTALPNPNALAALFQT